MPFCETGSAQIQQTGGFAYGLLDLSKDQEFQFSENPKVVHQADKAHHKKPGRKPLTNIPDSKRKAQILTAQRAFRDRKKCYVQDLENKVKDCEHSHSTTITSLQRELMELKERLARLEQENQTLKKEETTPISNCCNSNANYLLPTISNCSEAFRGLPAQFEYTQFPTLSSSTVSNQNPGVPSIPEMGYPQFEDPYQRFPVSNSYGNVDFVPAGISRVNILSGNLHSEPAHLSDSDPSTHSLSDIPKTPNDLRGTQEYTNSQYDPPFYHLDASTSPPSSVSEPSNNISRCNGCNSPELNPQYNSCNSPELNPQCNGCGSPEPKPACNGCNSSKLNPQCNGCDSPEPKPACNGSNSPGLKPQ
ncbi:DNA-binding transcription factor yap1 [Basidiobolus ranarum]|uniref:DNA-binding transcription factor yap1 n=1 Tax=Basidiobolus ranarum TaxID=34480 RepID=A0ABR2VU50_9FUNG